MDTCTQMETSELTGKALDWAVAEAEDYYPHIHNGEPFVFDGGKRENFIHFSTDWTYGGELLCIHSIDLMHVSTGVLATLYSNEHLHFSGKGDSALIAVCRAVVTFKLGETVMVPTSLLK